MRKALGVALICAIAAFVCLSTVQAQTLESGQIRGVITDQTGAAMPGVTVTLRSEATGFSRVVVTSESGAYALSQIPAGSYVMTVGLEGFTGEVTELTVNIGDSLAFNFQLEVERQTETIVVTADMAPIDVATAGVSQLISEESIENLPLLGRDFRDLAQLSSAAQVTPGLRGGLRLGGQQSDYTGLSIDGADGRDNFFGEFFGSLETKNSVIPIEAVQEFQVVTNGFAPEFGRSTGGLINVVTKSGTNEFKGSAHWYHRNDSLTNDDWLGVPPNIDEQNQVGAAYGGPLQQDRHFFFAAFDISEREGPLITKFARDVSGVAAPELGISDLGSLEGTNTQSQDLLSFLLKWDWQASASQRVSTRWFQTNNETVGFTGGRGQNQIQASFGNTEAFENNGDNYITTWTAVTSGGRGSNELKVMYSDQNRPRQPLSSLPEISIGDTGTFGQRFFLPIQGSNEKITIQENFQYAFGDHDLKFGADYNGYSIRQNRFFGWSAGAYNFFTLEDFQAGQPFGFIQGFGLGEPYAEAALQPGRVRQTAYGAYAQDKWLVSPRLTVNYGFRWDNTKNPKPRSPIAGVNVPLGLGSGLTFGRPPQRPPDDLDQWGPRLGASYAFEMAGKPAVLRASWGLYYAQIPTIFMNRGSGNTTVLFCFFNPDCLPPGGYPNLFPDQVDPNNPIPGLPQPPFDTNYDDPGMRNPQVENTTISLEWQVSPVYTITGTYAQADSKYLRTGGFSSTQWDRNYQSLGQDEFGRTILGPPVDDTVARALVHGSFSEGEFRQFVINITRRFVDGYQFAVNYSNSSNKDNAASERDTDTFFGPQDPYNIDLDWGRNALDIPNQLKVWGSVDIGKGFLVSGLVIARDGIPFPACTTADTNGDGVVNNGCSNDRPVVNGPNGRYLLERYPARQPSFFQWDLRVSKEFDLGGDRSIEAIVDVFNVLDTENRYANPAISSFVGPELSAPPVEGQNGYRIPDQISPGSTPLAIQLGARFRF